MKMLKVKYYEDSHEIIPLDPQPVKIKGIWDYKKGGEDEKGKYVVIDFLTDEPTFLDYDANGNFLQSELKIITEDEWNTIPENDLKDTQTLESRNVHSADVITLQKSHSTSIETSKPTLLAVIKNWIQTIKLRF